MLKLEMFKKDLNTKMKALESMRYNYIKGEQQSMVTKAELANNAQ